MTHQLFGLKQAVPYLQRFRNKIFVIKLGGSILADASVLSKVTKEIGVIHHVGIRTVVVHGGGTQLDSLASQLSVDQKKISGRRITDAKTLKLAQMIYAGELNTTMVSAFNASGAQAVGLSGLDGMTVVAKKKQPLEFTENGKTMTVDFGFVGDIVCINSDLIQNLLTKEYIPVFCSLAGDREGQILNINADTLAQHIAVAMKAEKLINITNVPGILKNLSDPQSVISYADIQSIEQMKKDKIIQKGMIPKVDACIGALLCGVPRGHIIDGKEEDSLLKEIFTNEGCGTMLVKKMEPQGFLSNGD